ITPSDTLAKRPWIRPRLCGGKRCNSSDEVCVRQQIGTNSTSRIQFRRTCIKSSDLPQNVTGPCSRVLCLDGFTCILPRRKFYSNLRFAMCKVVPVLRKPVNGTRRI
ncbi:unnamed protein product, partial [Allacma fusca]